MAKKSANTNANNKKYAIGIDLGTTNSELAYAPLGEEHPRIELLSIPQLVAPSTVESRPMLPSFLYLATQAESGGKVLDLPWAHGRDYAAGALAYKQAADVPARTVTSAKSWLCYSRVDRRQPILPWNAPADVAKISPVEASRRYLEHMIGAWADAFPDAPFDQQEVVLTVPASFDASARDLTREAALAAGLPEDFVLLEEPQAALYAWLAQTGDKWRRQLKVGDTLLVCDVGGGTTDLTLIRVAEENGQLVLQRIAVGNHILVGGDNMDLTLAHFAREGFAKKGVNLDPWQSVALWHSCRVAKEALLSDGGPEKHPVVVLGRGSKLIGGSVSIDLERDAIGNVLLDGFFPACKVTDKPQRQRASGFREIGLPFESDAAITRHLAEFLRQQGTDDQPVRPTHVLFNGGVFKPAAVRQRVIDVIGGWFGKGQSPAVLSGVQDLDYAVAKGGAYYAATRTGKGVRIRGGTARSYYIGFETAGLAIPGVPRPLRALCVVPYGMEEGTETDVPAEDIGVVVGEPAKFRFFSSSTRKQDKVGDVLSSWTEDEVAETDSLETVLPAGEKSEDGYVPVSFHARITELGVLETWCVSKIADQRWKLEFSVRKEAE